MRILQLVALIVIVAALVAVLQLPDRARDVAAADFTLLPAVDLRELATANWEAGRRGAALTLLDVVVERDLPGAVAAAGQREQYRQALRADATALGQVGALGLDAEAAGSPGAFESLAGATVADQIARADLNRLAGETGQAANALVQAVTDAQPLAGLFPQADLALALAGAAACTAAMHPALQAQLAGTLAAARAAPGAPLPLAAAQETLLPLYQLARLCKSWPEFALLLGQARSADQLKVLIKIASTAPRSARQLAQILAVAGPAASPRAADAINVILRQGPPGLDLLTLAARKGPAGVAWIGAHPGVTLPLLRDLHRARGLVPGAFVERWLLFRARLGFRAMLLKYLGVAVLCSVLLMALIPAVGARRPAAGAVPAVGRASYWIAASAVGVTVSLLLLLGALAPAPAPDGGPAALPSGDGEPVAAAGANGAINPLSMTVMVVGILVVQGICWVIAHRRIKDVENDTGLDLPARLRRLENLDIFLDLPLYCGLAGTIFAFILITTFGAGVARFLAYSSTLVGIVLAVALRLFYVFPLRESLIALGARPDRG